MSENTIKTDTYRAEGVQEEEDMTKESINKFEAQTSPSSHTKNPTHHKLFLKRVKI